MTFTDVNGNTHKETTADEWSYYFKRGEIASFPLCLPLLGKIHELNIYRDESGEKDDWLAHFILLVSRCMSTTH